MRKLSLDAIKSKKPIRPNTRIKYTKWDTFKVIGNSPKQIIRNNLIIKELNKGLSCYEIAESQMFYGLSNNNKGKPLTVRGIQSLAKRMLVDGPSVSIHEKWDLRDYRRRTKKNPKNI